MRLASYVRQSPNGIFYLRVVFPLPVREKLAGRRELRRSLGTRDPRTARRWAQRLSYVVSEWLREARSMAAPDVDTLIARLGKTAGSKWEIDLSRGRFTANPAIPGDQEALLQAIDALGLNGPHGTAILGAVGSARSVAAQCGFPPASRLLSEVSEEFLDAQYRRTQNAKTRDDYRAILRRFQSLVGDKPIADITVEDVAAFFAKGTQEDRAPKTLQKWVSSLHTVLRDAQARGYLPANMALPTTPMNKQLKRLPVRNNERLAFELEDLQRIFDKEQFLLRNIRHPGWFWVPLLGLFCGGRIEEFCQLRLTDIRHDRGTGIWYLDINEHNGKTVKTQASVRRVPLHEQLIELGFLEYRDALVAAAFPDGRLFPYLPATMYGDLSGSCSKHFNRYLRKVGVAEKRKVYHSFRHTVATVLKVAGVRSEIRHRLLGHTLQEGEHATYVHADVSLRELYCDGIAKIQYDGLDLQSIRHDPARMTQWIEKLAAKRDRLEKSGAVSEHG